ncbi:type II toxin-antitoxin system RelE/ParE family toxin [Campylobacter lanienae]|uniref:type II toxin-antitoxin system RelE/ParE family toxin n=1 Tax=Campylobacter lanienae TaxID=75658 RepID=UPI0024317575|nr:type II toxin-antitoxin system RelE/ParE family toxin [Campylobacter lanienae]
MFEVVIYDEKTEQFLNSLRAKLKVKTFDNIALLEYYDNGLKKPFVESFDDGLFKLRSKSLEGISRIFFTYQKDKIIIIFHGFIKKTQKTPANELEKVRKTLKKIKEKQ